MSAERKPLTFALLLSLLIHGLLLSLTFSGQGWGLPGLGFPWQDRRAEAPELRVVLMPARDSAAVQAPVSVQAPLPRASIEPRHAGRPTPEASVSTASIAGPTADVIVIVPETETEPVTEGDATMEFKPAPEAAPAPIPALVTALVTAPTVVAVEPPSEAIWAVPPSAASAASAPAPVMAAAPGASSPESAPPVPAHAVDVTKDQAVERATANRLEQEAQGQAALLEAAKLESERKEAARRQTEQVEAQRLETERQQLARQVVAQQALARQQAQQAEIVRLDAERQELARQEDTRQEAARQQAQQVETARREAAQQEVAHQQAQRVESTRLEVERQQLAREAAARQETARAEAAQDEARREASRRAMGRQLDEEAARREAASAAANLASRRDPSSSGARRGRLFGRTDPNAELVLYAEAWARKIELNMTVDRIRDAAKRPHANPLVTVAIRSDGSVESVTFVLPSGVAEIDDAIRRIVESLLPYPAFSPGLAREYDVIEIRRSWVIDSAVRLY